MSYQKQTWENSPSKVSPFSAERMEHIENGIKENSNSIDDIDDKLQDSGWILATLSNIFKRYENNDISSPFPRYRKYGDVVEIRGVVTPVSDIPASEAYTNKLIFVLPEGYRPSNEITRVCHGSSEAVWLMRIKPSGNVELSRYAGKDGTIAVLSGDWFPFQAMFFVD